MKIGVNDIISCINQQLSVLYLKYQSEKPGIIILMLHALFKDRKEIEHHLIAPQEAITIDQLRQSIEFFLEKGYQIISPSVRLSDLNSNKKYLMITFDDGYFNNKRALDVLKEFTIPALFSITTNYVKQEKCFWWDVIYRERTKQCVASSTIEKEIDQLKDQPPKKVKKYMENNFSQGGSQPRGDLDRPFTKKELIKFAQEEEVIIGNHSASHANLARCDSSTIRKEVFQAQSFLEQEINVTPKVFAFPFGQYGERAISIIREGTFKWGLTVDQKKNKPPYVKEGSLKLLHRQTFSGRHKIFPQLQSLRSDIGIPKI